ncbi:MAG: hypothetical protein L7U72_12175 [Rubripirellula sp.]|nr:hypothetical protein [Rubripirellula sp.]
MSEASSSTETVRGGGPRQTVLLVLLGVMVVALAYDYKVARPNVDAAYEKIVTKSMQVNSKSTEVLTNLSVRELLEMEPSETREEANGDLVEVFSWRSGLPIRTHNLYAVYKKNGENWLFHRHSKFIHESSSDVSQHDVKGGTVIMSAGTDADQSDPDAVSEGGGEMLEGSPDGGGEGGRPQGRPAPAAAPGGADPFAGSSAFDPEVRARAEPEAVFAENDENEDGKLESYEIPQISNQTKVKMDTDGDGVLTKEEWMAEMKPAAAEGEVESSEGEAAESDADATASQPELAEEPESAE